MMSIIKNISFPCKVLHDPVISRSDDGRYSLCTHDGIIILHPLLKFHEHSSDDLQFSVTRIASPSETFDLDVGVDKVAVHTDAIKNFDTSHNFWELLDKTISPSVDTKQSFRGFKLARWSPHGVNVDRRCVVAGLTLDHRLCIYNIQKGEKWWSKIIDISELYHEKLKKENFVSINSRAQKEGLSSDIDLFKAQRLALATVDMAWTEEFHSELYSIPQRHINLRTDDEDSKKFRFVLFAVALRNGQIAIWKFLLPLQFKSDCKLLTTKSVAHDQPVSLHWCQTNDSIGFLTIGLQNGTVKSFVVKHSIEENFFSFGAIIDIWKDKDNIPIGPISWNKKMKILSVAKGPFLLAFEIQMKSRSMEVAVVRSNHSTICSQFPINAMWKAEDLLYVSSSDGKVYSVKICKSQGMKIEHAEFPVPGRDASLVKCHGLVATLNNIFVAVVDSPSSHYCHLTIKNPLSVTFFNARIHKDIIDLIMSKNAANLSNFGDAFLFLKHNYQKSRELSPEVQNFIDSSTEFSEYSHYTLKLLRMFLLIYRQIKFSSKEKFEDDIRKIQDRIDIVDTHIMRIHVKWSLQNFKQELETDNLIFSNTEKVSALKMCEWVSGFDLINESKLSESIEEIQRRFTSQNTSETCSICSEDMKFNLSYASCSNDHKFYRCSSTMIVCGFDVRVWQCETCDAIYNTLFERDWCWIEGDVTRCIFCDSFIY